MAESKPQLVGVALAETIRRVADEGNQFAMSVRAMQDRKERLIKQMRFARDGGVSVGMLRALLPGMTDAVVEDLMKEERPVRRTAPKKKAPAGKGK